MNLKDALKQITEKGFTHAVDEYDFRKRRIENWMRDKKVINDANDLDIVYPGDELAYISRSDGNDDWSFSAWKGEK